jgi:hypothetical protein
LLHAVELMNLPLLSCLLFLLLSGLLWLSSTHPSAAKGPLHQSTIAQTMESTREQAMRQSGMGTSKEVH